MPKALRYECNAVVYCKGDHASSFYVLKSGKVCVSSDASVDLKPDQGSASQSQKSEWIVPGGIFGVQAFLGKFPQRDTVFCVVPSEIVAFDTIEFERMVENNKDFVFYILRMLALELSTVHERVARLVCGKIEDEPVSLEDGFYNVANYLFNNRCYHQAIMAMERYLKQYPDGKHVTVCEHRIPVAKSKIGTAHDESFKLFFKPNIDGDNEFQMQKSQNGAWTLYQEALSMFEEGKYAPALHKFSQILRKEGGSFPEDQILASMYYVGVSLMKLNKCDEAISLFTTLVQKHPKYEKISDAMFYLAKCYEEKGDIVRSGLIYDKLAQILPKDSPLWSSMKKKKEVQILE